MVIDYPDLCRTLFGAQRDYGATGADGLNALSAITTNTRRVIVAGTRKYADEKHFHRKLIGYLKTYHDGEHVIFISGDASTGADNLIIRWCKVYPFLCVKMSADWDQYGKRAGYIRNSAMATEGTHLLTFFDGSSRGTAHMIKEAQRLGLHWHNEPISFEF